MTRLARREGEPLSPAGDADEFYNYRYPELQAFQSKHGTVCACACGNPYYMYSFFVFEKEGFDALDFFAKINDWDDGQRTAIEAVHPKCRVACRKCRWKYEDYVFVKQNIGPDVTEEDLLHDRSFARRDPRRLPGRGVFVRSFYSGGVFDSKRHSDNAYTGDQALTLLESQRRAEKTQHFVKHDTNDGYLPRFIFGTDIDELIKETSTTQFAESKRPPVGLNPERFVAACDSCQVWLTDCEFGVKYCEKCIERKPQAKAD